MKVFFSVFLKNISEFFVWFAFTYLVGNFNHKGVDILVLCGLTFLFE